MNSFYCTIVSLILSLAVFGQDQSLYVRKGNKLYKEKQYESAAMEYQKSLEANAGDPVARFNLGNAYYRNKNYNGASDAFNPLLTENNQNAVRQKAYYNKGVSLSREEKLEESIEAYKQAVRMNPSDEDARINLQKALLEWRKKNPPKEEKKEEKKKQKTKNEKKQQPPPSLNKKQVEQFLKALQQREQQVQQKMQQQKNRSAGKQEKDW